MVTIKDVAKRAGVSVATVSRVFNGSGPVSETAALRIRDVAASLNYVPHYGARSLITSKTATLGVLLPDLFGEFFSEVIRGMDQMAQQHSYQLLVSSSHDGKSEIERAMRAMRGRVDGIIAMSPHLDAQSLVDNLPPSSPVVILSGAVTDDRYLTIAIDNTDGARAMVEHFISLGHRRIAIINGAAGNQDALERREGYRLALEAAGLVCNPSLEAAGDFTEATGHGAALELIKRADRPTAIFAANDVMAIGAISALRDAGIGVPQDIAVAGFDDIPLARYMNPPLTTVHVPIAEMGALAVTTLVQALKHSDQAPHGRQRIPTTLVIRQSCGGELRSN